MGGKSAPHCLDLSSSSKLFFGGEVLLMGVPPQGFTPLWKMKLHNDYVYEDKVQVTRAQRHRVPAGFSFSTHNVMNGRDRRRYRCGHRCPV